MCTHEINLAADVVLFSQHAGRLHVLLIERNWPPFEGRLALPGGYVDPGETFETAARRELEEETGLTRPLWWQRLDIYDAPHRDPRHRMVSVAYLAFMPGLPLPTAGDDARTAQWVPVTELLTNTGRLAFDHHQILTDAIGRVRKGHR